MTGGGGTRGEPGNSGFFLNDESLKFEYKGYQNQKKTKDSRVRKKTKKPTEKAEKNKNGCGMGLEEDVNGFSFPGKP